MDEGSVLKVDPQAIKRPTRVIINREFKDWGGGAPYHCKTCETDLALNACPNCKDKAEVVEIKPLLLVPMIFRKLGVMEQAKAQNLAIEMLAKYVTGYGDPAQPNYQPPELLPPIDGEPVFVSETACNVAAMLCVAQIATEAERYTFEDLVSFMTSDAICGQMIALYQEIPRREGDILDPLAKPVKGSSATA